MMNFYQLDVDEFPKLDLTIYTHENLKELSYYVWAAYSDVDSVMQWREQRLLPLLRVESLVEED